MIKYNIVTNHLNKQMFVFRQRFVFYDVSFGLCCFAVNLVKKKCYSEAEYKNVEKPQHFRENLFYIIM